MLIGREPMLDSGRSLGEAGGVAWATNQTAITHLGDTTTMTDPGVLGTLHIGLDHVRADRSADGVATAQPSRAPGRRRASRHLAAVLRWMADALEPTRPPGEAGTGRQHASAFAMVPPLDPERPATRPAGGEARSWPVRL
jgi:hypothetical protein